MAELRNVVARLSKEDEALIEHMAYILGVSESKVIRNAIQFYVNYCKACYNNIRDTDPSAMSHEVKELIERINDRPFRE